jgi:hypothetical protein
MPRAYNKKEKLFYPDAARRLYLAVIAQAVTDVLENGEESEAAERWLLSRDFDVFVAPFACDPDSVRQKLALQFSQLGASFLPENIN